MEGVGQKRAASSQARERIGKMARTEEEEEIYEVKDESDGEDDTAERLGAVSISGSSAAAAKPTKKAKRSVETKKEARERRALEPKELSPRTHHATFKMLYGSTTEGYRYQLSGRASASTHGPTLLKELTAKSPMVAMQFYSNGNPVGVLPANSLFLILNNLSQFTRLRTLDLSFNTLDASTVAVLAKGLKSAALENLYMLKCSIGPSPNSTANYCGPLAALGFVVLSRCRTIDLRENFIGVEELESFLSAEPTGVGAALATLCLHLNPVNDQLGTCIPAVGSPHRRLYECVAKHFNIKFSEDYTVSSWLRLIAQRNEQLEDARRWKKRYATNASSYTDTRGKEYNSYKAILSSPLTREATEADRRNAAEEAIKYHKECGICLARLDHLESSPTAYVRFANCLHGCCRGCANAALAGDPSSEECHVCKKKAFVREVDLLDNAPTSLDVHPFNKGLAVDAENLLAVVPDAADMVLENGIAAHLADLRQKLDAIPTERERAKEAIRMATAALRARLDAREGVLLEHIDKRADETITNLDTDICKRFHELKQLYDLRLLSLAARSTPCTEEVTEMLETEQNRQRANSNIISIAKYRQKSTVVVDKTVEAIDHFFSVTWEREYR